jgi:hypothetical protein
MNEFWHGTGASVTCPADHPYAISGGGNGQHSIDDHTPHAPLAESYPLPPMPGVHATGWHIEYGPSWDGTSLGTITVYAICAK